jgi:hypothetical protein
MAVIKKYEEQRNPDGQGVQYQQKVSVTGAATSDEILLPPVGTHGFSFTTTGTGTIEVTMSSEFAIDNSTDVWFDNDIPAGPALSANTIGTFRGISAVRINNASGTSTLEILTKVS